MAQKDNEDKQAKREAKAAWEKSKSLMDVGDYRGARQMAAQVAAMVPDTDLGREAVARAEDLRIDRWAIYAGLGYGLLYLTGWLVALL
jgi:hypothetical protein